MEKLYEFIAVLARQRDRFALAHVGGHLFQTRCNKALPRLDEAYFIRAMDILLAAIPFAPVARTTDPLVD